MEEMAASNLQALISFSETKTLSLISNMLTLNTILKELKSVPVERLKDLYYIIHSFRANTKTSDKTSKTILSFAGSFSDMSEEDYNDFIQQTKNTRKDLFDRYNNL